MQALLFDEPVFEHLERGGVLLCATRRLAREWRQRYNARQLAQGRRVWETGQIHCWPDYWERSATALSLLSVHQEQAVWEEIIRRAPDGEGLLDLEATAAAASAAWLLAKEWDVPLDDPLFENSADTLAFRRWAGDFSKWCAARKIVDRASLAGRIAKNVNTPGALLLAGFDEFTPQQKRLLDALASRG